jgi:hypothetical protein
MPLLVPTAMVCFSGRMTVAVVGDEVDVAACASVTSPARQRCLTDSSDWR